MDFVLTDSDTSEEDSNNFSSGEKDINEQIKYFRNRLHFNRNSGFNSFVKGLSSLNSKLSNENVDPSVASSSSTKILRTVELDWKLEISAVKSSVIKGKDESIEKMANFTEIRLAAEIVSDYDGNPFGLHQYITKSEIFFNYVWKRHAKARTV